MRPCAEARACWRGAREAQTIGAVGRRHGKRMTPGQAPKPRRRRRRSAEGCSDRAPPRVFPEKGTSQVSRTLNPPTVGSLRWHSERFLRVGKRSTHGENGDRGTPREPQRAAPAVAGGCLRRFCAQGVCAETLGSGPAQLVPVDAVAAAVAAAVLKLNVLRRVARTPPGKAHAETSR